MDPLPFFGRPVVVVLVGWLRQGVVEDHRALQRAIGRRGTRDMRHDPSHRLAVLGDHDRLAGRRDLVDHGEKLRFALRRFHGFCHSGTHNMTMVMTIVILIE